VARFFGERNLCTPHVCVQAIDSNANNLVSRYSTCARAATGIFARATFSPVSLPLHEILSGRQPVHRIHQSGAMRATSKSPYIVNSRAVYTRRKFSAYRQTVSARVELSHS